MTNEQITALRAPFKASEIEWLISATNKDKTHGYAAPYVDSRAVQERFDTVLGSLCWQDRFITVPASTKEPGTHICEISIKTSDMPEWITKSDGAGSTDIEPIKGGLSGAFKRAASMWGVGRYLYEMQGVWVAVEPKGKSFIIAESELTRLANYYTNKTAGIPGKSSPVTRTNQTPPEQAGQLHTAQSAKNRTSAQNAPSRRQIEQKKPEQTGEIYQIREVKTTRGGKSVQTFVSLQKNDGKQLSGYIRGDAMLQTGQRLTGLRVVKKNDPNFGDYNIIENYAVAA